MLYPRPIGGWVRLIPTTPTTSGMSTPVAVSTTTTRPTLMGFRSDYRPTARLSNSLGVNNIVNSIRNMQPSHFA